MQVYRLIRRKAGRGSALWEFNCNTKDITTGRVTIWGADDFYVSIFLFYLAELMHMAAYLLSISRRRILFTFLAKLIWLF